MVFKKGDKWPTSVFKKWSIPRNKNLKWKLIAWNKWIPMREETKEKLRAKKLWWTPRNKWLSTSLEQKEKLKISHLWQKARNRWLKLTPEQKKNMKTQFVKWMIPKNKWIPNYSIRWDKNINWKWGVTPENEAIRHSIESILRRRSCYERDNWCCGKCNINWWILNVHHIHNFADYPELRTSIENWITLCKICHDIFHKIYWKKNNTKEQLQEFLTSNI